MAIQTLITDDGVTAATNAINSGVKVAINRFKFGSAIITPNSTMTDVTTEVYDSGSNPSSLTVEQIDKDKILFRITLDSAIGNFDIGNIGLFLEDGTMFSITAFEKIQAKWVTDSPNGVVGNNKIFNVILFLTNLEDAINFTINVGTNQRIPVLADETELPTYIAPNQNVYYLRSHTQYDNASALAVYSTDDTEWQFTIVKPNPIWTLPVVADESALPTPANSLYEAYKIEAYTAFDNQPAIALRVNNNTEWNFILASDDLDWSLPVIATENDLPTPANSLYSTYKITNHSVYNVPGVAINDGTTWHFSLFQEDLFLSISVANTEDDLPLPANALFKAYLVNALTNFDNQSAIAMVQNNEWRYTILKEDPDWSIPEVATESALPVAAESLFKEYKVANYGNHNNPATAIVKDNAWHFAIHRQNPDWSLPRVANESGLPSAATSIHEAYIVNNNTAFDNLPGIAIRKDGEWTFSLFNTDPAWFTKTIDTENDLPDPLLAVYNLYYIKDHTLFNNNPTLATPIGGEWHYSIFRQNPYALMPRLNTEADLPNADPEGVDYSPHDLYIINSHSLLDNEAVIAYRKQETGGSWTWKVIPTVKDNATANDDPYITDSEAFITAVIFGG